MFEAAVTKFVKNVGGESGMIAVPDLNSAVRCKTLAVVEKRRRRWFWRSPTYTPVPDYSLNDVLVGNEPLEKSVSVETRLLTSDYHRTHQHSVSGSVGATLKELLDVEAKGSDSISVESKLGDIQKVEVNQRELMEALEVRKLDFDNGFVKELLEQPRKVLCVITGVAVLKHEGTVSAHSTWNAEEELKAGKEVVADGNEDGSISADTSNSLKVPAGTPIAYEVRELLVKADGSMKLLLDKDHYGGLPQGKRDTNHDEADGEEALNDEPEALLLSVLGEASEEEHQVLTQAVQMMCSKPQDVHSMLQLLCDTEASRENVGQPTSATATDRSHTVDDMKTVFISKQDVWTPLLTFANFEFKNEVVNFPADDEPHLRALRYLFEALSELDEESCTLFGQVTEADTKNLYTILSRALEMDDIAWPEAAGVYRNPHSVAAHFANSLGFSSTDHVVLPPVGNWGELQGACRSLAALWPDCAEKHVHPSRTRWCILL